jgi:ATP-dependent Clp protease adaptor protein ClpS
MSPRPPTRLPSGLPRRPAGWSPTSGPIIGPTLAATAPPPRLADEDNNKRRGPGAPGTAVITKTKPQTKRPSLYRVLLLNDDYTPMDFVVQVQESIFHRQPAEAYRIMMQVHTQGSGVAGVYTHEVAETKVATVVDLAQDAGYPLQAAMEKV